MPSAEDLPKRAIGVTQNPERGPEEQCGDDATDNDVRPSGNEYIGRARGDEYAHIGDQVVPRAQPRRTHVQVVGAMAIEQGEADDVGGERKRPDNAHRPGVRNDGMNDLVRGLGQHGQAEREHECAFRQRGPGLPTNRSAEHEQAESVYERVAEHVQCVCQ